MTRFGLKVWGLSRDQRGVTGLETAIVLIAFVVVSSGFRLASRSTGLLSSDKSEKTFDAGLREASGYRDLQGASTDRYLGRDVRGLEQSAHRFC